MPVTDITTNPDDFVGLEQLIAVESVPRRR